MGCSSSTPAGAVPDTVTAEAATPTTTGAPAEAPAPETPAPEATPVKSETPAKGDTPVKGVLKSPEPSDREADDLDSSMTKRRISFHKDLVYPEIVAGKQEMMVPVPSGFRTGDQYMMQLPDGRKIPVTVPKGYKGGQMFKMAVPNRKVSTGESPGQKERLSREIMGTSSERLSAPDSAAPASPNGNGTKAPAPSVPTVKLDKSIDERAFKKAEEASATAPASDHI